ncbi:spore coat protein [Amycolatopsis sp. CA-230715]|uniref:spore coat protein n=1 Tax=Amycolatopsis sp. CA-230715 TaxID=2745196 RepID=UPI001C01B000|nr:spore coat protein [Amycolatopsis sp. CA-230715]QWF80177.1 hypothetical protein HUW46_03596 [Amycolatopsis sp. CA-230715]
MTRLLLRADSSATIGAGHIARVVAFAEEAVRREWTVEFSGHTENAGWLASRLDELGVRRLPPVELGSAARKFDAVLVDHYGIGEVRDEVRAAGAVLVSMEDGTFGRRAADVVVDCGFAPAPRPDDGSTTVLSGPKYAPVRGVVRAAREKRAARETEHTPPRVLVVLGGGGVWVDAVESLLVALRDTGLPFSAEALVRGEPSVPEAGPGQEFRLSPPGTNLPELLAETDLAISAAGVTLLELCCIGVPTALVQLVDNQATGYRAALDLGLATGIGTVDGLDANEVLTGLLGSAAKRAELAAAASTVIDGRGAARVLDAVRSETDAG